MLFPLVVNSIIDGSFAFYMIYLDRIGSKFWQAPNGKETLAELAEAKKRIIVQSVFFLQYVIVGLLYWMGGLKYKRFRDAIVIVFVISVCIIFKLTIPLQILEPEQYVSQAIIVLLRCSLLVSIFGVNGLFDVIFSTVAPVIVVILMWQNTSFTPGSSGIALAVVAMTVLGVFSFNFIMILEQRRLFGTQDLLEKKEQDLIRIVDLFSGTVLIF